MLKKIVNTTIVTILGGGIGMKLYCLTDNGKKMIKANSLHFLQQNLIEKFGSKSEDGDKLDKSNPFTICLTSHDGYETNNLKDFCSDEGELIVVECCDKMATSFHKSLFAVPPSNIPSTLWFNLFMPLFSPTSNFNQENVSIQELLDSIASLKLPIPFAFTNLGNDSREKFMVEGGVVSLIHYLLKHSCKVGVITSDPSFLFLFQNLLMNNRQLSFPPTNVLYAQNPIVSHLREEVDSILSDDESDDEEEEDDIKEIPTEDSQSWIKMRDEIFEVLPTLSPSHPEFHIIKLFVLASHTATENNNEPPLSVYLIARLLCHDVFYPIFANTLSQIWRNLPIQGKEVDEEVPIDMTSQILLVNLLDAMSSPNLSAKGIDASTILSSNSYNSDLHPLTLDISTAIQSIDPHVGNLQPFLQLIQNPHSNFSLIPTKPKSTSNSLSKETMSSLSKIYNTKLLENSVSLLDNDDLVDFDVVSSFALSFDSVLLHQVFKMVFYNGLDDHGQQRLEKEMSLRSQLYSDQLYFERFVRARSIEYQDILSLEEEVNALNEHPNNLSSSQKLNFDLELKKHLATIKTFTKEFVEM